MESKETVSAARPALCVPSTLAAGEGNSLDGAEASAGVRRLGRRDRAIGEFGLLATL